MADEHVPTPKPAEQQQQQQQPVIKLPSPMSRQGLGSSGRKIEVLCNHFAVLYTGTEDVYHYDVSMWNDAPGSTASRGEGVTNKTICRSVMKKLHEVYGNQEFGGKKFAYDGEKSLFSPGPLTFQTQEFSVILEDRIANKSEDDADEAKKKRKVTARGREFKVKIEYAATVKMGAINNMLRGQRSDRAQDALRVLDIVMRQHAAAKGYLLIRDSHFSPMFGISSIGEGVDTCKGYHVSIRPAIGGLSLNMDLATTTVFEASSVLDFVKNRFNPRNENEIDWDKVKRVLKGVKVETPHNNMIHRIIGFSDLPASELKFVRRKAGEDGNMVENEMTIKDYYEIQYNISLRYSSMPCVVGGRPKKPTYIPVELCHIVGGQRYTKLLSSNQRQKMIDDARQDPEQRKNAVQKAMDVSNYSSNDLLQEFGIKINQKMRRIPARVLDAPMLKFGNNCDETPRDGRWNYNNKSMVKPQTITSWVVLSFDGRKPQGEVERIALDLSKACMAKGMTIGKPQAIVVEERGRHNMPPSQRVHLMMQEVQRRSQSKPNFILCILPIKKTSDLYGPLKKLLQTKFGVVSQCIAPPKMLKDQYLTNVALKINAKVGGFNTLLTLECQRRLPKVSNVPTVIFGMDVSHGPAGYSDSPSIAAVVASQGWPQVSSYAVRIRAQSRKVEMISGLYDEEKGGMIVELLKDFYHTCNKVPGVTDARPQQVIIFRDGVSESQFSQVISEEFLAFKKAFRHIQADYSPRVTLIVVQKRHHTRFFPVNGPKNVQPGTIIDDQICHPCYNDFYLCAHNGLIGTTRPTHYHVLIDENNFSVDELQQLTHYLCYIYARSTTAVSTVAPVAYAHLAAAHARNFLDSEGGSETSSLTAGRGSSPVPELPALHRDITTKMFYC